MKENFPIKNSFIAALVLVLVPACSLINDADEKDVIAPLPELVSPVVELDDRWSRSIGSQGDESLVLALTPAMDGGTIYAANASGLVMAISRADGAVRWKSDLDASIVSAVGAGSDMVVASTADGGVHALHAASGEIRWRAQASSEVLAAAAINNGVVVVQGVDSRVQAFDADTGALRWSYSASQAVLSLRGNAAPVMRDGVVYVAFDNGKAAALDAVTGLLRWEQRFIVPDGRSELERVIDVQADPLVTSADVVVGAYQGAIVSLSRERGQPQWQEKASVSRSMAEGDGSIFTVEGDTAVRALRLGSGREAWKNDGFAGRKLSAPAVIGDYVAFADREGYIHLFDQSEGNYAGRYKVGSGVRANLLGDGDALYVLTDTGRLYALVIKR